MKQTSPYSIFVIDDDPDIQALAGTLLDAAGHRVFLRDNTQQTLDEIRNLKPDCVITDIMMSGMDGLALCQALRSFEELGNTRIIVLSSKGYASDRQRAADLGADAYLRKPILADSFAHQVEDIIEDRVEVTFWGVRGTLPVPGSGSLRYGGNTICVSLDFAHGPLFIFDAGTGIKGLSDLLMSNSKGDLDSYIFISHPHWDHINALPFFGPLYQPGNKVRILGAQHGGIDMEHLISAQMDGIYFPITARAFAANVSYQSLQEEVLDVAGVTISTMLLNHPGHCLGYRIEHGDRVFCYITDNELYPRSSPDYNSGYFDKLADFVRGADMLVTDTTYTDEEYEKHRDWGHSPVSEVVHLAHAAQVKNLYLFHHDPDQDDDAIDTKMQTACLLLKELGSDTRCIAPREKDRYRL